MKKERKKESLSLKNTDVTGVNTTLIRNSHTGLSSPKA